MEPTKQSTDSLEPHILEQFRLVQKVGSGAYGHVWKVENIKSGKAYALKKIFDAFQNATDAQRTFREVYALKHIHHPNIIQLVETIKSNNGLDLYLVFEYVESDLHSVVREDLLQLPHQKFVMAQLARAMLYLHSAEVLHRDLKPSNILINQDCQVKVCDFGLAKFLKSLTCQHHVLTQHVATRWYRSPEMLLGCATYGKPTDIWSLGCILAEMMTRRPLFPGNSNLDQLQRVLSFTGKPREEELQYFQGQNIETLLDSITLKPVNKDSLFRGCDPLAVDLMMRMLRLVPEERITAQEMLEHPFLEEFSMSELNLRSPEPILCPINDNNKLSIREYRNMVYDTLHQRQSRLKLAEGVCRRNLINRSGHKLVENRSSNQSKSDWASPYLREATLLRRSPYRRTPLRELSNEVSKDTNHSNHQKPTRVSPARPNNTIHISANGKNAISIYREALAVTQHQPIPGTSANKHLIRKRRYRKQQHRQQS